MELDIDRAQAIRNGYGRPPRLTPRLTHTLADLVRQGVELPIAARGIGLPAQDVHNWQRKGRAAAGTTPWQELYRDFVEALEVARAEREQAVDRLLAEARAHLAAPPVRRPLRPPL